MMKQHQCKKFAEDFIKLFKMARLSIGERAIGMLRLFLML
jgi:hypothetical protein